MPTGNTYLDGLAGKHGGLLGLITDPEAIVDFVLWAHLQDAGIIISNATVPIEGTTVLFVNAAYLSLTKYPSKEAVATAIAAGGFVHAEDLDVVGDHITHKSSATYDIRLKRGDNGEYRKIRTSGMTFARSGTNSGVIRISSLWLP